VWLGIDDTDSPLGGCTTWVLTELLREARAVRIDLIGEPRLVRLNPNIPWKTRGNAALSARFGHGSGPSHEVGEIEGRAIRAFRRGTELQPAERERLLEVAWARVLADSDDSPGTDPALVASTRRLPASFYWNAVREVVSVESVRRELDRRGCISRTRGDPRGLVGAAASLAWPGERATWEAIAYRRPERRGTPREVDAASVRAAQRSDPNLFLCHDPRTRRLLVAPHTACPILFGLRGRTARAPRVGLGRVRSEPIDRWVLYRTNQGTGDHLVPRTVRGLGPYLSGVVEGTVVAAPRTLLGGHVTLDIEDRDGARLSCVAFEPTKTLPRVARSLRVGDRVRIWGSRGEPPGLRLEGIRLLRIAQRWERRRPSCPDCERPTHSLGHLRGYRCRGCGRRLPPEAAEIVPRPVQFPLGEYHPTPSARRHLAPRAPEP
jgi:tRNA(Ile2)-agmatinylcytidine synthase